MNCLMFYQKKTGAAHAPPVFNFYFLISHFKIVIFSALVQHLNSLV